MSAYSRWRARIRAIAARETLDRDLDRELAGWVDELVARFVAQGLSPDEARRRALVETGGVAQVKARVHDVRPRWLFAVLQGSLTDRLRADVVTAWRSLLATPAPTSAAVLTLAVAVGVNLAMAGLIGRALLDPPAHVVAPDRVFTVGLHPPGESAGSARMTTMSYVAFRDLRDRVAAIDSAAAFQRSATSIVLDGEQRRVNAALVSGAYFDLLGARPRLGAGILPAHDDTAAGDPVAVVSHAFWRSAFGRDPGVLERTLTIRGLDYRVAGVMPEGFSGHSATEVDLWIPLAAAMRDTPGWDRDGFRRVVSVVVRLAPGATAAASEDQAQAALGRRTSLSAIAGAEVGATERRVAWWLTGVSVLVLVIGLANAGTLLIVRAARRRRDAAIRLALGASRGRLAVQAIVEALVLSAAATAAALLLASWLDDSIRRVLFPDLIERRGLSGATAGAAALAGLLAACAGTAANLWGLRTRTHTGAFADSVRGRPRRRALSSLLILQTTLSVLLLAGAGLFGRSLYKLASQDLGMTMDRVVYVEFEGGPGGVAGRDRIFASAIEQIRRMPGIDAVTPVSSLPFGGFHVPPISVPGRAEPPSVDGQLPFLIAATPEFMRILGIQIVEGRTFTAADDRGAPAVIVNQTMAREVWPGTNALGRCIRIGFDPDFDPATAEGPPVPSAKVPCRIVIGVARDVRQRSLLALDREAHLMQYYVPFSQIPVPPFAGGDPHVQGLLLRAGARAEDIAPAIRRAVVGRRTDLPFVRVVPYASLYDRQMRPWRLGTSLLALFSALAIGVAAMGLYAAFAHAVALRRREMAIRLAIGARPTRLLRLVIAEALRLAAVGAAAGCVAAVVAGRWLQSLLFDTAASDPLVLGSAAAFMLLIAAAATLLPARTASKADPNVLLRVQ